MEGDEAFADFVSACWPRLHRLAYLLTADEAAAEALLRGAMESTYARWSRVRESDDPEAEVRATMVADLVPTGERRLRPREWVRESLPGQRGGRPDRTPPPVDTGVVDRTMLWPLLCALPQRERAVLVLRYHEELTAEETAELLGCSPARVRADAHDALVAIRRGLDAARTDQVSAARTTGPPLLGSPPGEVLER